MPTKHFYGPPSSTKGVKNVKLCAHRHSKAEVHQFKDLRLTKEIPLTSMHHNRFYKNTVFFGQKTT